MCAPIAMAGLTFALGAAQAVTGFMGQQAQFDAQAQQYKQNAENANKAAAIEYHFANRRIQQERAAAAEQKADTARQVRDARATAYTAAGESGVAGNSVDNLLREFSARGGAFNVRTDMNTEMTTSQILASQQGTFAKTQGRINSVERPRPPSFLDAGIRILGAGLDAGSTFMKYS